MNNQRTIAKEVFFSGIALHTGHETTIHFKPAPPNFGIKFYRTDLPGKPEVSAHVKNVINVVRGTNIQEGEAKICTVEHLMAALLGLGIDNIIIEMNASEPPVGDGSSLPFLDILKSAGMSEQDVQRKVCALKESVYVNENGSYAVAIPSDKLTVSCTIAFDHPEVQAQYMTFTIEEGVFEKEIAPSRTFCFYHEVESLMNQGLIKGGSLDNAVVVGDEAIFSKEQLRFKDEFVRHKILDILGDICLLGRDLKAHIIAIKPGHSLNIKLARKIFENTIKKEEEVKQPAPIISEGVLDIVEIMKILPHRYPFLLVDRIVEMGELNATGIKNVTMNEPFFNGHFPGRPVMPGVLMIEAMAQVGGVMMLKKSENAGKIAFFMTIENVKFRKTVHPGDQLVIKVALVKARSKTGKVHGEAYVGNDLVAEADLMFSLVDA